MNKRNDHPDQADDQAAPAPIIAPGTAQKHGDSGLLVPAGNPLPPSPADVRQDAPPPANG